MAQVNVAHPYMSMAAAEEPYILVLDGMFNWSFSALKQYPGFSRYRPGILSIFF